LAQDLNIIGFIPQSDTLLNHTAKWCLKVSEDKRTKIIEEIMVPSVLALVMSDIDYKGTILSALKLGWKVEIYFWNNGMKLLRSLFLLFRFIFETNFLIFVMNIFALDSLDLFHDEDSPFRKMSNAPVFQSLNDCYKAFTYGIGHPLNVRRHNMKTLELTGDELSNWEETKFMSFFDGLDIFRWWSWEDNSLLMYFKDQVDLRRAQTWLHDKYSQIEVWQKRCGKR